MSRHKHKNRAATPCPPLPEAASSEPVRTLYLFEGGSLRIGEHDVETGHLAALVGDAEVELTAGDEPVEVLMLQGRPIGEPVAQYGPFVLNDRAGVEQAFRDYQRTGFGGWPFDRMDPVRPRGQGRFAVHADGRREEPAHKR